MLLALAGMRKLEEVLALSLRFAWKDALGFRVGAVGVSERAQGTLL